MELHELLEVAWKGVNEDRTGDDLGGFQVDYIFNFGA